MSEVMNPNYPDGSASPLGTAGTAGQVGQGTPMAAAPAAPTPTAARPALVTFAAIMMFIVAAFQLIFAIVEFYNAAWFADTVYGTFSNRLWLWGIVDLIMAAVAVYAGYDLLRGGTFGRIVGLVIAAVIAARWFFYIPAEPWAALVMIALAVLIIYGIVAHPEYFGGLRAHRGR